MAQELELLVGKEPAPWLVEMASALRAAKSVASTRKWLVQSPGGVLLSSLASGVIPLSHSELDQHPGRSTERLRSMLLATGGLEPDARSLARLERHALDLLNVVPDNSDRQIVESWLRWNALPRIRRRTDQGLSVTHSAGNLKQQTRLICEFIAMINTSDRTLKTCLQADLDDWFALPGSRPSVIRSFLSWARANDHLHQSCILPSSSRSQFATTAIDANKRWDIARRLIDDSTIYADDRVAGALVVLYAQPVTRIAALTIDSVKRHADGTTSITFPTHQIDLSEPFGDLARKLPQRRQAGTTDHLTTRWLFPSQRPDRPVIPVTIANRLRKLGIEPRATRQAAVAQLAAQIPPALLAESIGIGARTAAQWTTTTGGNWSRYV